MSEEDELWFFDTSNGFDTTIGQFIDFIESKIDLNHEIDITSYALCHLKGAAHKFATVMEI